MRLWLSAMNVQTHSDKISTLNFYLIMLSFWSCTVASTVSKHPPATSFVLRFYLSHCSLSSDLLYQWLLASWRAGLQEWQSTWGKMKSNWRNPGGKNPRMIKSLKTAMTFHVWLKEWFLKCEGGNSKGDIMFFRYMLAAKDCFSPCTV